MCVGALCRMTCECAPADASVSNLKPLCRSARTNAIDRSTYLHVGLRVCALYVHACVSAVAFPLAESIWLKKKKNPG